MAFRSLEHVSCSLQVLAINLRPLWPWSELVPRSLLHAWSLQLLAPRPKALWPIVFLQFLELRLCNTQVQAFQLLGSRCISPMACASFPSYRHPGFSHTLVSLTAGTCGVHPLLQFLTHPYEPYGLWSLQLLAPLLHNSPSGSWHLQLFAL